VEHRGGFRIKGKKKNRREVQTVVVGGDPGAGFGQKKKTQIRWSKKGEQARVGVRKSTGTNPAVWALQGVKLGRLQTGGGVRGGNQRGSHWFCDGHSANVPTKKPKIWERGTGEPARKEGKHKRATGNLRGKS